MAREGGIPHIKISNRLRFPPEDIEKWLRLREVAAQSANDHSRMPLPHIKHLPEYRHYKSTALLWQSGPPQYTSA
jgi:hypothetical protein